MFIGLNQAMGVRYDQTGIARRNGEDLPVESVPILHPALRLRIFVCALHRAAHYWQLMREKGNIYDGEAFSFL
jgi:hypothetical protein